MTPKVTFITTIDRNPGDAFIRAGIEFLLQQIMPFYVPYYVDKHDIRSLNRHWWFLTKHPKKVRKLLGMYLNLFERNQDVFSLADLIVQAGTPLFYISPNDKGLYDTYTSSITTDWVQEIWINRLLSHKNDIPIINMAVGTCQPYHSDTSEFDRSHELIEFIERTVTRSSVTIVRERNAFQLLRRYNLNGYCLPCASIFACNFHGIYAEEPEFVAVNYMHGGSHYTLGQNIDFDGWQKTFTTIYNYLKEKHRVVVVCHAPKEVLHIRSILPEAETFYSNCYEDYLRIYAKTKFGVLNRVHGGMAIAGFGRPSVIIGNDTRVKMAEMMELPIYFVNDANPNLLMEIIESFESEANEWNLKLTRLKEDARLNYLQILTSKLHPLLENLVTMNGYLRTDFDSVRVND